MIMLQNWDSLTWQAKANFKRFSLSTKMEGVFNLHLLMSLLKN